MEDLQPIIVIKKKGGHGGHHGGAWKVAYADFVTAMMALFIVLWLTSSTSKATQVEISGYFRDPKGTSSKHGADPTPQKTEDKKQDMTALKNDLLKAVNQINALNKLNKQIEMTVTEEGLRIEMLEDAKGTFFETGKAQPQPVLEELLKVLSGQLKTLPNSISIEGHTDAAKYADESHYDNWELSVDRANVARHEMQEYGIRRNQISQVRGFADQRLHVKDKPLDPANRRISLVVQSLQAAQTEPGDEKTSAKDATVADAKPGEAKAGEEKSGKKAETAEHGARPASGEAPSHAAEAAKTTESAEAKKPSPAATQGFLKATLEKMFSKAKGDKKEVSATPSSGAGETPGTGSK